MDSMLFKSFCIDRYISKGLCHADKMMQVEAGFKQCILFSNAALNTVGNNTVLLASDLPEKQLYSTLPGTLDTNFKMEVKTFSLILCEI